MRNRVPCNLFNVLTMLKTNLRISIVGVWLLSCALTASNAAEQRVNALDGAVVSVRDQVGRKRNAQLHDGNTRATALVAPMPLVIEIDLAGPTRVGVFRLFDGDPRLSRYPSGPSRATVYRLEGLNRAGQWRKLAERSASVGDSDSKERRHDFEPIELLQLRLHIEDSNDTRKRVGNKTVEKKAVILREIQLFADKKAAVAAGNFTKHLFGEFRLPVYRDQSEAALHLHNSRPNQEVHSVNIDLRERASGKTAGKTRKVGLAPGVNIVRLPLDGLADGEYIATITDGKSGRAAFRRLLRLQRSKQPPLPSSPVNLTGRKMFFPDAHLLDTHTNIHFVPARAEMIQVVKPDSVKTGHIRHGYQVYVDRQDRLHVPFYTVDRQWSRESRKHYLASQVTPGSDEWTYTQTATVVVPGKVRQKDPINSEPPMAAKPDWKPKPRNGNIAFRFYDQEKDGRVDLRQVKFEYTRRYSATSVLGEKGKIDWGDFTPPSSSTFPIWYKSPGEAVILTKTPLLRDNISSGEFEAQTDSNDNFVGQWISDDGKTLSYSRGRLLKRYPPFTALYDNLAPASRIIAIVSTTNGLDWNYSYMIPPDENLPPIAQQYGAVVSRVPGGNGLKQAFVSRYLAREQSSSIELAYSWDGANWRSFPSEKIFIDNGPPGTWNAGFMSITRSAVVIGKDAYQLISWVDQKFHFYGEIDKRADFDQLDGPALKKYFAGRELEKWPHFETLGGYDGIAADAHRAGFSVGLAKYRVDGLFGLRADSGKIGKFTTRLIVAQGAMTANAKIAADGVLEMELLDSRGGILPNFTRRLSAVDGLNLAVFSKLPAEPFRVRVRMWNSILHTVSFAPDIP